MDGKSGISMFHQLHCLVMLRDWMRDLKAAANVTFAAENGGSSVKMGMGMSAEDVPDFGEMHPRHYFDYLHRIGHPPQLSPFHCPSPPFFLTDLL